jgi:tape measure domain-containing protein
MVDETIWKLGIQLGNSQAVLDGLKNALSSVKDRFAEIGNQATKFTSNFKATNTSIADLGSRAAAAGLDLSRLTTSQVRASEAAKRLELAQAQATAALARANDMAKSGSASAERIAVAYAQATLAAARIKSAEDAVSVAMQKVQTEAAQLSSSLNNSTHHTNLFANAISSAKSHIASFHASLSSAADKVVDFGSKAGMGIFALQQIGQTAISVAQSLFQPALAIEQTNVAFKGLFQGNQQAAAAFLDKLHQFDDASTFFDWPTLTQSSRSLIAMKVGVGDIIPLMRGLGNTIATMGGGTDEVNRAVLAIGQMSAKTKISAEEMNQLTEVGIPGWDMLSESMHKPIPELMKMSEQGKLLSAEAIPALIQGMERFSTGMADQATTAAGMFDRMKNSAIKALIALTSPILESAKGQFKAIADTVSSPAFQQFATTVGQDIAGALATVSGFLSGTVIPAIQTANTWIGQFTGTGNALIPVLAGIGSIVAAVVIPALVSLVASVGPFLLLGAAIAGLTAIFLHFYNSNAGFREFINSIGQSIQNVWKIISSNFMPALQIVGSFLQTTFQPVWQQLVDTWQTQLLPSWNQLMVALQRATPLFQLIGVAILIILVSSIRALAGLLPGVIQVFGGIVQFISGAIQIITNIIMFFVHLCTGQFDQLGGDLGGIWQGIVTMFSGVWNIIIGIFRAAIGYITGYFSPVSQFFIDKFNDAKNGIVNVFGNIGAWFGDRYRDIQNVFIGIGAWFGDRFREISAPLMPVISYIGSIFQTLWNIIIAIFGIFGKWFRDRWQEVVVIFSPAAAVFRYIFTTAWNAVTGVFAFLGGWFRDRLNEVISHVISFKDSVIGKFNEVSAGVNNIFHNMINSIIDRLNNGITAVENFVNFFGQGLNSIAAALGTRGVIAVVHLNRIPHYAEGTAGHPGGPMVIGEEGPELVIAPRGTAVLSAQETRAFFSGRIPGYAGGIGDITGSIIGWIAGGAKSILDNVIRAMGISTPNMGGFGDIGSALFEKVKSWAVGWIDSILPKFDFGGGTAAPGDVQSWIAAAMAITSVPGSWAGALATIAMHESGGNPRAINLNDINAINGDPSRGLFQTIGATFRAYALAGHGDIYNPVDNAIAAIRYILARYGSVFNVPGIASMARGGAYVGYALGGMINEPIAGLGLRSGTSYMFGERGPELVTPAFASPRPANDQTTQYLAQMVALLAQIVTLQRQNSGNVTTNNNVNMNPVDVQRMNQIMQSLSGYGYEGVSRGAF